MVWFILRKFLYDGIEDSVGRDCVVVIKVIIGGNFFVNMESRSGVQMKTFLLEL